MIMCTYNSGRRPTLHKTTVTRTMIAAVALCLCGLVGAEPFAGGLHAGNTPLDRASTEVFAGLERIDEAELAELRGGLSVGGINIELGATLRTLIDNIELATSYRITEAGIDVLSQHLGLPLVGAVSQQRPEAPGITTVGSKANSIPITVVSQAPAALSNAAAAQTSAPSSSDAPLANATLVGPGSGVTVSDLAPAGVQLNGIENYRGLVLNDVKGFTAALHDISRKAVISSLVSTASDRKISQRLNLDVRLGNVKQLRAAAVRSALSRSIRGR